MTNFEDNPRVKIRCPHCESKIDITEIEPEAYVGCPVCEENFYTPNEDEYDEYDELVARSSSHRNLSDKTHHFSTRRNIVTQRTLKSMQKKKSRKTGLVATFAVVFIGIIFIFFVSRQDMSTPPLVAEEPETKVPRKIENDAQEAKLFKQQQKHQILRPRDLNFEPLEPEVEKYLLTINGLKRNTEKLRFQFLFEARDKISKLLKQAPMSVIVVLRSSQEQLLVRGFTEEGLFVEGTDKRVIPWKDLDVRTFSNLLINDALKSAETLPLSLNSESDATLEGAAKTYFQAAVILDWYGYKTSASELKSSAISLAPDMKEKVLSLLP
ncbi:MAG: hypothetical protein NE330_11860 [Lentisphaeraceae bacterium]|nr:hypothetical protein [Lentisphaeraceae bacterium]